MPFYIFAWVGSISAGIYVVISKLTSKYSISNPWYLNFLWSVVVLVYIIPIALINHAGMPHDWVPIMITALFSSLFNFFLILSIYLFDVTTLSPLFNFRTVFAVLLGTFFLKEQLSFFQWAIVGVIVIMGILATYDEKFSIRTFFKPSILIGLSAMLFLALSNAFTKIALVQNDLWTTNVWTYILNFFLTLTTIPLFYKDVKKIKINQLASVSIMGFFSAITNISSSAAYKTNVGVSSIIMSVPFSMIIAFFLSMLVPKLLEKHTLKVYAIRFIAAIIMIYGALQISK